MMQINTKRCLSLILALVLSLSLLPVSTLAADGEEVSETIAAETTAPAEATVETIPPIAETTAPVVTVEMTSPVVASAESTAFKAVQAEIDRILDCYGISDSMTAEKIVSAVDSMETMTYREALYEISVLESSDEMQQLTDEELLLLDEQNEAYIIFVQALSDRYAHDDSISLFGSASDTALDAQVSISASDPGTLYSSPEITVDGTNVTVYQKGGNISAATTNVTITNNSTNKKLSFNYYTDGHNSGDTYTENSAKTVTDILPGAAAEQITLTAPRRGGKAYLYIKDLTLVDIPKAANVKFEYDTADVTVDGTKVEASGTTKSISTEVGATINATGSNFIGWINTADNKILSTAASFTLVPTSDMTIKPIYGPTARFEIDKTYLFEDFSSAVTFAAANVKSTIALANNGTLTGSITVPEGITLLIPYDDARTLCTTTPYVNKDSSYKKPTAYRTLTMSAGSSIIVNGALSLSGEACTKMGNNSCPMGPLSFITMASDSNITINNGGKLYAWGYITGSGTVTVESGGVTYENFQLKDWRGGEGASSMINNTYKVFPVSQYYVQNVEVPMEFKQGASAKGYLVIVASSMMQSAEVPFIGTGSMFVVGGTSLVKDYIESADRLQVDINGNLSMSSLQISLDSYNMDSNSYTLPITNNLTVNINSGTTSISQDMAILPGAEITVAENATLILSSGKSVYVYDMDTWSGYVYYNLNYKPLTYANKGTPATRATLVDAKIIVNGTLDASSGYLYTSSGGANICSEGNGIVTITPGTSTVTYQATQEAVTGTIFGVEYTKQEITYHEIPITPAKLQHGDGTYLATGDADQGSGTYYYNAGHARWVKDGHSDASETSVAATCTTQGYTHNVCTCGYEYDDASTAATGHSYNAGEVTTPATCTSAGIKTYTCQNDSSHTYTESVAALGHTNGGAVTENNFDATCTEAGSYDTVVYCSVCDTELSRVTTTVSATGHTAVTDAAVAPQVGKTGLTEGSHCETCGDVLIAQQEVPALIGGVIYGTSVRAGDCLDIYFYLDSTKLEGDNYNIQLVRFREGKADPPVTIAYSDCNTSGDYRIFSYAGIAAKEMTDTVSVTVYDNDGVQISETLEESIEKYARRALKAYSDQNLLRTTLVDMLNYGAAAQTNWTYNTGALANANLTETQKSYASSDITPVNNTKWVTEKGSYGLSATVTARSNLFFSFYFSGVGSATSADIAYTDHYGKRVPESLNVTTTSDGSYHYVDVTGLAIADGRQVITCTLKNGDTELATVESSVESYIAVKIQDQTATDDEKDLCQKLMNFIDSAYKYFHSGS